MFRRKQFINGIQVRPARGKCPGCKVKEKEWCKPNCWLLDPCHMARE